MKQSDNSLKKYTGEAGRKLKERIKEHNDDGGKYQNNEKITGISQHMKTTGHFPPWDYVRIIYKENNQKMRNFKEAARITSHNEEQLMKKKMKERQFPIYGTQF